MSMRKWLIILAALVLILAAGCSGGNSDTKDSAANAAKETNSSAEKADKKDADKPKEPVEISIMGWGNEQEREIYASVFKKFEEKNPHYKVNYIYVPQDYETKLKTMIVGNTLPDVFYIGENTAAEYVKTGKLADLEPFFTTNPDLADLRANFVPGLLDYGTVDGKVYAIPKGWEPYLMYINKDLFTASSIDIPTGDWTKDEFMNIARALTVKDGDKITQYGVGLETWWGPWTLFAGSEGGEYFKDGKSNFSDPKVIKGLQTMYDLFITNKSAPSPNAVQTAGMGQSQMFETGSVAMYAGGGWMIPTFRESLDFEWTAVEMPLGEVRVNPVFAGMLSMSEDSKNKDAAAELMAFILSKEGWMETVSMGLEMPANMKLFDDKELLTEPPALAPRIATAQYQDNKIQLGLAKTGHFSEFINKIVQPELDNAFAGKQTIEEAAKKIDDKANSELFIN
jgi:multiple sugar transport system substrate-binding protein